MENQDPAAIAATLEPHEIRALHACMRYLAVSGEADDVEIYAPTAKRLRTLGLVSATSERRCTWQPGTLVRLCRLRPLGEAVHAALAPERITAALAPEAP